MKKQSRARGKRIALSTAEDRPGPGENATGEGEEEEAVEVAVPPPTMYRWVSSARAVAKIEGDADNKDATAERVVTMSFSVPVSILPAPAEENKMDIDGGSVHASPSPRLPPTTPPKCDVQGCTALRKYRLVRDFQKGACGMGHLKVLEAQTV